jgi:Transposase DDE domain
LAQALDTVEANDLLVADRNFGVLSFLFGMVAKKSYFIIRQHQSTPFNSLSPHQFKCRTDTGRVFEEFVLLRQNGQELKIRRILIKLKKPTRNNEWEVAIFSNLPAATVTANQIAAVYQSRWGIETAFQKVEKYLNSELNTLGYPKAALFGFGIALVAFNLYAVVMAAIRAANPAKNINDEVSDYYIAEEISTISGGMSLIVQDSEWNGLVSAS